MNKFFRAVPQIMFVMLFLLLAHDHALAQTETSPKISVVFDCGCDDIVGSLYATAFRDLLASSPRYTEMTQAKSQEKENDKVFPDKIFWGVHVVSLDSDKQGNSTSLAVVITVGNHYYIDTVVQTCGSDVVKSCASKTLSVIDQYASRWAASNE